MHSIIEKTRYKIFEIKTNKIKYCISPSKYCDYTQFNSSIIHPHAGQDRGVFKENLAGYVRLKKTNWDLKQGILFSRLLEYQALLKHYNGKENWKKSEFAKRYFNYIKVNKLRDRGFSNPNKFLLGREKQIDALFESILKKGIYPVKISNNKKMFIDNISIALTKDMQIFFNNRGHHRLSIAKILGIKKIPIKITIAKSKKQLEKFCLTYDYSS